MKCFVDTNVLAYAKDSQAPTKQKKASDWIATLARRRALVVSAQSLREFYAVSLRRDRSALAVESARQEVSQLAQFMPPDLIIDRVADAWTLQDRHQLSFWDALLIASARAADCTVFLSEDLNAGQQIASLKIVNPFTTSPDAILGAA